MINIILIIIVVLILYMIVIRNQLIKMENKVDEAFSTMDVYLKKRWDIVPNLVNCVRSYSFYEKETLENITLIRNGVYDELKPNDKIDTNLQLEEKLKSIIVISEDYPVLKADNNFLELTKSLTKIEEDIANSRKYYNAVVRMYNNKVEMFPSNIVANLFKFKIKLMFEAQNGERKNIKVDL